MKDPLKPIEIYLKIRGWIRLRLGYCPECNRLLALVGNLHFDNGDLVRHGCSVCWDKVRLNKKQIWKRYKDSFK